MRCLVVACVVSIASPALAHFRLIAPDSMYAQDGTGSPLFTAPCGDSGTPTGPVTTFQTGATISVDIQETIFHPGHYRVALAPTAAMLPPDPQVNGAMCDSAVIDAGAQSVLVDGALQHTTMFSSAQSIQVTLPATPCTNCVLQVIEFYSNHAPPCFHYHCATITIAAPPMADAGVDAMPSDGNTGTDAAPNDDAATGDDAGNQNALVNPYANQGCSTGGGSNGPVLILAALLFRRRSRRT